MSLRKRNGIWHIDILKPDGQRFRRSTGTTDKTVAQEIHDKIKAECWKVRHGEKPSKSWSDAARRWLSEKATKASIANDKTAIAYFDQFFDNLNLDQIDRDAVEEALDELEASNATKNRYVACIRAIINKCAGEWKWLPAAPKFRTYEESKIRIRWITRAESERLLKALPPHYAEVAAFALATGLRMSNILKLEWSQVDMQRRVAWVHPDQAKARRAIGVPLSSEAVEIINARIGKHHELVFQNRSGNLMRRVESRVWKDALQKAGISDFRFHDLRHTWASWHVQSGTPLHVLQELGGWESVEMVKRYAHLAPEHLAEWADNSNRRHVLVTPSDSEKEKAA